MNFRTSRAASRTMSFQQVLHPLLGLVLTGVIACDEGDGGVLSPGHIGLAVPDSVAARAALERENPYQWVGRQHNAMMDLLRERYRLRGLDGRDACAELSSFDFDSLVPDSLRRQVGKHVRTQATRAGIAMTACRTGSEAAPVPPALTPGAASIVDGIERALRDGRSPGDVAIRLAPQVKAATGVLRGNEREAVLIAAAVAQASSEYWGPNWSAFLADVRTQYGECVKRAARARDCAGAPTARHATPVPAAARGASCHFDGAYSDIWEADAKGALTGAFFGAFAGGPAGALTGGILAGAASSAATAIIDAIEMAWCML